MGKIERMIADTVHAGDQFFQRFGNNEILAFRFKGFHRRRSRPPQAAAQKKPDITSGEVRILFGARKGKLLLDNLLRGDEPAVTMAELADVLQRRKTVEARQARCRHAIAIGIEP